MIGEDVIIDPYIILTRAHALSDDSDHRALVDPVHHSGTEHV